MGRRLAVRVAAPEPTVSAGRQKSSSQRSGASTRCEGASAGRSFGGSCGCFCARDPRPARPCESLTVTCTRSRRALSPLRAASGTTGGLPAASARTARPGTRTTRATLARTRPPGPRARPGQPRIGSPPVAPAAEGAGSQPPSKARWPRRSRSHNARGALCAPSAATASAAAGASTRPRHACRTPRGAERRDSAAAASALQEHIPAPPGAYRLREVRRSLDVAALAAACAARVPDNPGHELSREAPC
jgi:hypothetical protein